MTRQNAALSRRRLRSALREMREALEATQREVCEALDWSTAKLMRIEGGKTGVSTTDLRALLSHYQVTDKGTVATLTELARASRVPTLGNKYKGSVTEQFAEFLDFEEAATVIRHFETQLIPGPLQTRRYAEAVLRAYARAGDSEEVVATRVAARMARKELYAAPDGPEAHFIIDEAALMRLPGRPELGSQMLDQLDHMLEMASYPNVEIQVVPFEVGIYPGLRGPFVHLEFGLATDSDLLYLENPDGEIIIRDDSLHVAPYLEAFEALSHIATSPADLSPTLERVRSRAANIPDTTTHRL